MLIPKINYLVSCWSSWEQWNFTQEFLNAFTSLKFCKVIPQFHLLSKLHEGFQAHVNFFRRTKCNVEFCCTLNSNFASLKAIGCSVLFCFCFVLLCFVLFFVLFLRSRVKALFEHRFAEIGNGIFALFKYAFGDNYLWVSPGNFTAIKYNNW